MKQQELLKRIKQMAKEHGADFGFVRRGGDHDIYRLDGMNVPIPRHREINERTAWGIIEDARELLEGEAL